MRFFTYRDFSKFNKRKFLRFKSDHNFHPYNIDAKIKLFNLIPTDLFNKHMSIKTRIAKKNTPWTNDAVKQ